MVTRNIRRFVLVTAIASAFAQPALATCTMQTQMANAQTAEQQRRLNNINTNVQTLTLLNQLETACLQNFQSGPTQWIGNSAVAMTAINKIEQSACQSLTNQARSTTQAGMAAAQAAVQQQINSVESSVVNSTGSSGMLSSTVQQATPSSGGVMSSITNSLSRLFQ
jgi:hypothetical protein